MSRCEEIQEELHVYFCDDVDELTKVNIENHLEECLECARAFKQHKILSEILLSWKEIGPSPFMYAQLKSRMSKSGWNWKAIPVYVFSRKTALRLAQVAAIVVVTLLINNWLQKPFSISIKDQATINFFLQEHQGAVVQSISNELLSRPASHLYVGRDDILYFEYVENHPKGIQPGMVIKGPKTKKHIALKKAPEITKGRSITKTEINLNVDFSPFVPEKLPNEYILTSIQAIEDYNALHLLFTRGLDTISLFQQSTRSPEGLSAQDFRDYALYCSQEPETDVNIKGKGTILAWSNSNISFVLIGDADLSELMAIVTSINQADRK